MRNHILKILFVIATSRKRKDGKSTLYCRITHNKIRKTFSTGLFITPKYWDSKHQIAEPPNDENDYINNQLSLVKSKINKAFLLLQIQEINFNVNDIYTLYKGKKLAKQYNTIEYFDGYLKSLKRLINIEIKQVTWDKYYYVKCNVKDFIKWKFKKVDIPLKELKLQFLTDLDFYLKVEKKQKQITVNKVIQRFRKPIRVAVAEGFLNKDPFLLYRGKRVKNEIIFLTTDELKTLENHQFSQRRLQQVKDWFVFSCYTGLAYNEIKNLKKEHIIKGFDGELWIKMKREKTQKNISVPLLLTARMMINKYKDVNSERIFNICSNQRYNSYLKEIASIIGLDKRLTTHTARKTFASTLLLYNDVPMEIVSKLLGHSSITITEDSYGKIVQKKVSEQMRELNKKLNS